MSTCPLRHGRPSGLADVVTMPATVGAASPMMLRIGIHRAGPWADAGCRQRSGIERTKKGLVSRQIGAATRIPRTAMKQVCPARDAATNANGFPFRDGIAVTTIAVLGANPRRAMRACTLAHCFASKTPQVGEGLNVDADRPAAT